MRIFRERVYAGLTVVLATGSLLLLSAQVSAQESGQEGPADAPEGQEAQSDSPSAQEELRSLLAPDWTAFLAKLMRQTPLGDPSGVTRSKAILEGTKAGGRAIASIGLEKKIRNGVAHFAFQFEGPIDDVSGEAVPAGLDGLSDSSTIGGRIGALFFTPAPRSVTQAQDIVFDTLDSQGFDYIRFLAGRWLAEHPSAPAAESGAAASRGSTLTRAARFTAREPSTPTAHASLQESGEGEWERQARGDEPRYWRTVAQEDCHQGDDTLRQRCVEYVLLQHQRERERAVPSTRTSGAGADLPGGCPCASRRFRELADDLQADLRRYVRRLYRRLSLRDRRAVIDAASKTEDPVWGFSVGGKIGPKDFSYHEVATAPAPIEVTLTGFEVDGLYERRLSSEANREHAIAVGIRYQRYHEFEDEALSICSPIIDSVLLECAERQVGAPVEKERTAAVAEFRAMISSSVAIVLRSTRDLETGDQAFELPAYFLSDDGKLTGGVRLAYETERKAFSVSVFVGAPFQVFSLTSVEDDE